MFRKTLGKKIESSRKDFRFRGHELKRIEAFSDAVFALAVTLLIVSLEVPKSFEELMITVRGFIPFSISFTLLMLIWFEQNVFFRRYGLDDMITVVLNCTLVFLVLFYVYPLKFLFSLIFSDQIYGPGLSPFVIGANDVSKLMLIYGIGYISIYVLFFLMYGYALQKKAALQLTVLEIFDTRTKLFSNIILISIGILSVLTLRLLPEADGGYAGMVYILIGPALSVYYRYRKIKRNKLSVTVQTNA